MSHSIRGALAGGGAWLAAAVLASCAAEPLPSPGWREAPPEVVALAAARGPLRAGAARVSADPPFAAPMAGYVGASWLRLREMRDPLFTRALVLECGDLRVALVSVDRVLLPPELREAVERRAELRGAGIDGWIAGATHSHTAPGGFLAAWPAELLGMGAYDPLLLDHLAACVARAVAAAAAALEPVTIAAASGDAEAGLSFNRRDPAAPAGRRIDVLRFTRSGAGGIPASLARPAPVARLVSFAAHPTLIPFYLRRSSGDYPGVLCRELERSGGVALFAAGPCGDLAAGRPEDTPVAGWGRRVERIGRKLAARANELETRATALEAGAPRALGETGDVPLAYVRARVRLPPREPWGVPFAGAAIASFYPEDATIQALRAGDVLVVTFPGEVGSSLGEAVRSAAAKATGARQTIVWTLTDHYAGYAFSREDHEEGGKSRHLSAYGPELGDLLVERAAAVAARCWELGGPDPPSKERG